MHRTALVFLEDDQRRQETATWLTEEGWHCVEAPNARACAALLEKEHPVLVVAEGPLADNARGVDAICWLRRAGDRTPVLFRCGSSLEESALRSLQEVRPYATITHLDAEGYQRVSALVPSTPKKQDMVGEGDLSQTSLEELFLFMYHQRWTGKLDLNQEGTAKSIWFHDGAPVYCSSTILVENFGQFLLRNGRITDIEYAWARKIQMREGIRQGEALVKIGVLSHQDLFHLLREQIKEKIINAFGWDTGTYTLLQGEEFVAHTTRFNLNAIELLVAGRSRFMAREDLHTLWGRISSLWGVTAGCPEALGRATARWVPMEVISTLSQPQQLSEVAIDQGWKKSYALALYLVLEKVGILRVADSAAHLPILSEEDLPDEALWAASVDEGELLQTTSPLSWDYNTGVDIQEVAESLWKTYLRMTGADYFTALGVDHDAKPDEIMAAREELMELYSEHRFSRLLDQPRHARALSEIQGKITSAAATLLNEETRMAYVEQMAPKGKVQGRESNLNRYMEAEDAFVAGLEALDQEPVDARNNFAKARNLNPQEPVYEMYYGWALYLGSRREEERNEGRRHITRAVATNPMLDDGYVFLGRIYFDSGDMEEAAAQARTALTFRPDHEGAVSLLREIERMESDTLSQWGYLNLTRENPVLRTSWPASRSGPPHSA